MWYWQQVRGAASELIAKWERFSVKARTAPPNTDLTEKPAACLEYIVVHELVHLLEPTHNARFAA